MASIRAIYILTNDNKILFCRKFPTIENRLQKKMGEEYVPINYSDRILCSAFTNQVIKEELIQEEFKCKTYKDDLEIDHQKMEELIKNVDINININNFKNYSECPIVTLNIQNTKIWPCLYIKKFKIYGVIFPNIDYEKYKSLKINLEKQSTNKDEKTKKFCFEKNINSINIEESEPTEMDNTEINLNDSKSNNNLFLCNQDKRFEKNNKIKKVINENNIQNQEIDLEDSELSIKNKEYEGIDNMNNNNFNLNNSNLFKNNIENINVNYENRSDSHLGLKNINDNFLEIETDLNNNNFISHSKNPRTNETVNKKAQEINTAIINSDNIFSNNKKGDLFNSSNLNIAQNQNMNYIQDSSTLTNQINNINNSALINNQADSNKLNNQNTEFNNDKKGIYYCNLNIDSKDNNNIYSPTNEEEKLFKLKKLYEEQDVSIVGCITLMENLLNYIISSKSYEENKIHTLISNMVPFGNIIETNINFMLESLNFLNQRIFNSNSLFSHSDKKTHTDQEKIKIPGWVTKIPTNYSENLNITIKEELKFVKHGKNNYYNIILCDISCLAELSRNCEITLPIKELKTNFLGNLRIHPCAKLENQNILNDATRIIFIPPHDEFKMGVFEIENFDQEKLPIRAYFCLKESAQNEVKLYLKVIIDENIISKFEYFYINIPLGHFGIIIDTKIMVQIGEVSLVNNKTTLHWDLQNKPFDRVIVLSGTVNYLPRGKDSGKDEKKEKNFEKVNFIL